RARELRPTVPETRCNLGNIYREKGQLEAAVEEYRAAVDLQPYFALAHNNLAVTYAMKSDFEAAAHHIQIARALGYQVHPDFLRHLQGELAHRKKQIRSS
ncbi:MAG: tetratricopeptide repeat protein, partial [Terriglobia bacterium]